jgi:hypothetical protein
MKSTIYLPFLFSGDCAERETLSAAELGEFKFFM